MKINLVYFLMKLNPQNTNFNWAKIDFLISFHITILLKSTRLHGNIE